MFLRVEYIHINLGKFRELTCQERSTFSILHMSPSSLTDWSQDDLDSSDLDTSDEECDSDEDCTSSDDERECLL